MEIQFMKDYYDLRYEETDGENHFVDETAYQLSLIQIYLGLTSEGITLNGYFVDHPEMVLGEITTESTQYGKEECTVIPIPDENLGDQLHEDVYKRQA